MAAVLAFYILLPLTGLAALRWGGPPEKIAALAFNVAAILSWLVHGHGPARWDRLQWPVLLVDLSLLAVLVFLVIRYDRRWLIVVTALHLIATSGHLARAADPTFKGFAYSLMESSSSFPALILLAYGTWAARRRARRSTS